MPAWLLWRICVAGLALQLACGVGRADDLSAFNAAVEDLAAHNRVAIGYLRTDAVELAAVEMERMKASWEALTERFGGRRPAAFADNPLYVETLVDVPTRIVGAFMMLHMGRPDLARNSLQGIRQALSAMRRASKAEVLADCVLDANAAMVPIAAWDNAPPDLADAAVAADVAAKTEAIRSVLKRCDDMAPAAIKVSPEFRRLIDGAFNGLAFIPQAIAERDNELLHRVVGELRAFDNLLAFRYG